MNMLTTGELAKKLRATPRTVRRWVKQGKIPCIKITTKRLMFHEGQVESALLKMAKRK